MTLYQVENGWMGESYVRAYVWAKDETEARTLAEEAFRKEAEGRHKGDEDFYKNLSIAPLLTDSAAAFCTIPSDSGWLGKRYG